MLHINAFRLVVHEKKIFEYVPYFAPDWAPKGSSPFNWTNLYPHPPIMLPAKCP